MAELTNFFRFLDSLEHAENFLFQKFFHWGSNFWKKFELKFRVLVIQLSILSFILFFRVFLGWKRAFDYQMGDNSRFGVVLGLKWGFLKYSDFPNFSKIELVFFANKKNIFYNVVEFSLI